MLDPMEIASDTFRQVMGRFATGISVVTTFEDDGAGDPLVGDDEIAPLRSSGSQELLENLVNQHIWSAARKT